MKNKCALAIGLYILIGVSTSCNKTDTKPAAPAPSTSRAGVISQKAKDALDAMEESYKRIDYPGTIDEQKKILASPEKSKEVQDAYSVFLKKAAECIKVAASETNGADQIALEKFSEALNKHSDVVKGLELKDTQLEIHYIKERLEVLIKDPSESTDALKNRWDTVVEQERRKKGKMEYIQSVEAILSTYLNAQSAVQNWKR